MTFQWPTNFARIPDAPWTTSEVDPLPLQYDAVKTHSWYKNLEPTLEQLSHTLKDGDLLLDYSGGTGIFLERLLERIPSRQFGVVIVDSSPKFIRLALEKFRNDERVGFRLIQYLKNEKRLQLVNEVCDLRFDALLSTNAIHLYYNLQETLESWFDVLKPRATAFVQSGNIRNPQAKPGEWIIDETVEALHQSAVKIVQQEEKFSIYRNVLNDPEQMEVHTALRGKYFLPARPVDFYVKALEKARFVDVSVSSTTIEVSVEEWYQFLSVYHDGVLGWIGDVKDRLEIMREALERVFAGKKLFYCCWSYLTAKRATPS